MHNTHGVRPEYILCHNWPFEFEDYAGGITSPFIHVRKSRFGSEIKFRCKQDMKDRILELVSKMRKRLGFGDEAFVVRKCLKIGWDIFEEAATGTVKPSNNTRKFGKAAFQRCMITLALDKVEADGIDFLLKDIIALIENVR